MIYDGCNIYKNKIVSDGVLFEMLTNYRDKKTLPAVSQSGPNVCIPNKKLVFFWLQARPDQVYY